MNQPNTAPNLLNGSSLSDSGSTESGSLSAEEIAAYVIETTMSGVESIEMDTTLFSSGIIDSMGVIQLVEFIESNTGRKVKPTEITLENFDTVDNILKFLST